jgi:uncharacterized short protein YbdD (DUF466 family)
MIKTTFKKVWGFIKEVSGDDAYERYLKHHAQHHPHETPLNRQDFFKQEQDRKWNSIKRCC